MKITIPKSKIVKDATIALDTAKDIILAEGKEFNNVYSAYFRHFKEEAEGGRKMIQFRCRTPFSDTFEVFNNGDGLNIGTFRKDSYDPDQETCEYSISLEDLDKTNEEIKKMAKDKVESIVQEHKEEVERMNKKLDEIEYNKFLDLKAKFEPTP